MRKFDLDLISKRNTEIKATIIEADTLNPGLIIFVHGFKADRSEGGRFYMVGERMAEQGFNSIYLDFPGCGVSHEPFDNYCVSNCLSDMQTAYDYMLNTYDINTSKLAMCGYSMGGRLTCLFVDLHPEFKTVGLWAGATYNGFDGDKFLDNDVNKMMAEASKNGYALALNSFDNTYLHLSKQFFDDMINCKPFDCLTRYQGNVIFVHGDSDITVPLKVSEISYANLTTRGNKKLVVIPKANHGFGLWDNHMEQSEVLTFETYKFFMENI